MEFSVDYPNEYVISVGGSYDHVDDYFKTVLIKSLIFKTNKGRTSPVFGGITESGQPAATEFTLEGKYGEKLIGFFGRSGQALDAIGAYFSPTPMLRGKWIQVEQQGKGPGPRCSHAIAMVGQKMYSFGGELTPNFHIDQHLYVFDFNTRTWSLAPPNGEVPELACLGVGMVAIGTTLYVFGGRDGNRSATWSGPAHDFGPSDVMLLLAHHAGINPSFHKSPPAWFKPNLGPSDNPSADSFLPCLFVFLVALPRNRSSMKVSSAPPRWRRISFSPFFPRSFFAERRFASLMMAHTIVTPSSFLPNIPSATWSGPAHDFGPSDVMLLLAHHAGINPSFHTTNEWKLITHVDNVPTPRSFHAVAADEKNVYVFGGVSKTVRVNTLHAYNIVDQKWTELPNPGESCKARGGLGLAVVQGKIWVVYGFIGDEVDDVHCFDLVERKWTKVETRGEKPSARSVFGLAVVGKYIIISGGEIEMDPQAHLGPGKLSGGAFVLDTESSLWEKLEEGHSPRGWCASTTASIDVWREGSNQRSL
ncbi:hypothetical protein HID58_020754 [Brassica napus]|uniref:Jacalin-type lectin domain-containing protein n=1 Tax=Brassica napus TaxID=3708 RepID=A0ABQ8CWU2_BRANA|nr:hypothetical protein HID58_020754 [Brassica napus]